MVTKEEMQSVIDWCENKKKERSRPNIVERNQFREGIDWMRRFALIEIDRPIEIASKMSLVYDSTTKQLLQFMNGSWRRIEPDIEIKRGI